MADETMKLRELTAKVLEYEHALEQVAADHDGACPSCQRLARSALAGENRGDFRAWANDLLA